MIKMETNLEKYLLKKVEKVNSMLSNANITITYKGGKVSLDLYNKKGKILNRLLSGLTNSDTYYLIKIISKILKWEKTKER